jgi:hypothetical protein
MPMRTNADGSFTVLINPQDEPKPQPECPGWTNAACSHLARTASATIKSWGQLRSNFLTNMYESATNGHFGATPTAEGVAQALSRELNAPDEATKEALQSWIATIAAEAVAQIDQAKETVRQRAESRAEWARQRAEQDRVEAERQAIMDRSEWERQDVLAKEAEAAKWAAYEAQQAEHAAYKARTTAPTETNATC